MALAIYVAGAALGLVMIDATPMTRIALAILWPLGPLALAVTISILLVAAMIAFPLFGAGVLLAAAALWAWLLAVSV